jgi:phospholipid transport system substrate-binding protein
MRRWPVPAVRLVAAAMLLVVGAARADAGALPDAQPVQLAAAPTDAAQAPVVKLHDALVASMKAGKGMAFADRMRTLAAVVNESYNFPVVTEIASGPYWNRMNEQERKSIIDAFSDYSVAKYAANFDKFTGERFELVGQKPGPGDSIWVLTRLVIAGQSPVTFNYLVRQYDTAWRIVDVYTMGSISEVSTQRSQFMSILRDGGVNGLLKALTDRTGKLEQGA